MIDSETLEEWIWDWEWEPLMIDLRVGMVFSESVGIGSSP